MTYFDTTEAAQARYRAIKSPVDTDQMMEDMRRTNREFLAVAAVYSLIVAAFAKWALPRKAYWYFCFAMLFIPVTLFSLSAHRMADEAAVMSGYTTEPTLGEKLFMQSEWPGHVWVFFFISIFTASLAVGVTIDEVRAGRGAFATRRLEREIANEPPPPPAPVEPVLVQVVTPTPVRRAAPAPRQVRRPAPVTPTTLIIPTVIGTRRTRRGEQHRTFDINDRRVADTDVDPGAPGTIRT